MKSVLCTVALALFVAASPGFALGDDAKPKPKSDLDKLQGKWTAKLGPERNIEIVATFSGKSITAAFKTPDGEDVEIKGEIVLNESAKPHKTIDWVKFKSPTGEDIGDNFGLYVFEDDDSLKVCNGGPGNDRPTEFKAGEGGAPQLFVLKRMADKKAEKDSNTVVKDDAKPELKGDLAKFQGEWTAKVGPEKNIPVTIAFKATDVKVTFTTPDGEERSMEGKMVLDESAKPHPALTMKGFTTPDGNEAPENLGIYKFEGKDSLTVCSGGPGNDRPTEFKAGEGGPPNLIVFTRKAAEKK